MTEILPIIAIALVLSKLIVLHDQQLSPVGRTDHIFTALLILSLTLFAGLRTFYNDTITYIGVYEHLTPLWSELPETEPFLYSQGIGFSYVNVILRERGFSTQNFLMFYSFVDIMLYILFIRKYATDLTLTMYLFFTSGIFIFALAGIKQTTATAICIWSIPFALDRKWFRFILIVALGCMFHPYALVYFAIPFLMFEPWKEKMFLCMGIFIVAGFYLESLLGTVLSITDMMGAEYSAEEMLGEGVNLFRVLVCFAPLILSIFYGEELFQDAPRHIRLFFNLALVNGLIMFVGLFGTANYFARLANYFLPGQMLIIPWMIRCAHPRDRRWILTLCVIGFFGYFAYENWVLRPFDSNFSQIPLRDYLASLF